MSTYLELETAIAAIAAESPEVVLGLRSLHGTRETGDMLIVERKCGRDTRLVHLWATVEPAVSFYWGLLPPPGEAHGAEHGEGKRYGNLAYRLYFVRAFLIRLDPWARIPMNNVDGSVPGT